MLFYVNISKKKYYWDDDEPTMHFGRLELSTSLSEVEAIKVARELMDKFPIWEGWQIQLYKTWQTGQLINTDLPKVEAAPPRKLVKKGKLYDAPVKLEEPDKKPDADDEIPF